jgi:hypothetical protein
VLSFFSSEAKGTEDCFFGGKSGRGVKLTIHLHLVPKLRMVELHFHSSILLHCVVLNQLRKGIILPVLLVASQLREHVCALSSGISCFGRQLLFSCVSDL